MIHRHCRTETARLEAEVRASDRHVTDCQAEIARLRDAKDAETSHRWDAAGEAEHLKDQLAAADDREKDLHHRVWELECQINDLTETDSPVALARTRQTRAVHRALVQDEEARAQVLLALPWQEFDPQLELLESWGPGRWRLEDDDLTGELAVKQLLRWRYGLTETEIRELLCRARSEYRQACEADLAAEAASGF